MSDNDFEGYQPKANDSPEETKEVEEKIPFLKNSGALACLAIIVSSVGSIVGHNAISIIVEVIGIAAALVGLAAGSNRKVSLTFK